MPSHLGLLSDAEKQFVMQWLYSKWSRGAGRCPIDGKTNWVIGDYLVAPNYATNLSGVNLGSAPFPQVVVICGDCGHTLYFNAVVMGLIPSAGSSRAT